MLNKFYFRDSLIINIAYVVCLILILLFAKKLPKKKVNFCLTLVISFLYIFFLIAALNFWKSGKSESWLFYNVLPTANVSPLMFFLVIISLFLPRKYKNWLYSMVGVLGLGFAVAGEVLAIQYSMNMCGVNYIYFNSIDVTNHFIFSLFSVYLIKSGQIDLDFKKFLKNISFLFAYIFLLIIINVIFNTTFFGLCFTNDYNIYRMQIVSNAYLSALLYLLALTIVLLAGYYMYKLINMKKKNKSSA